MTNNGLFSILIAQYNNGKYLEEAISSVRNQTYTNWEIIIVDDYSIDNSEIIYNKIKDDPRIKIYYNNKNYGCGYTKRRCVELASGELCGFLDPDDVILPNAIQSMVNVHNERPSVSIVFSRFYYCDSNLNIFRESRLLEIPPGKTYFTHGDFAPEVFAGFKKSFYEKTPKLSESYLLGVDQDLYFKMEEVGEVFILNEFTYKYRKHKNAISRNNKKAFYWNTIVRHDTCIRRGLDITEYSYNHFYKEIAGEGIGNTREYKLGKLLLSPLRSLQRKYQTYKLSLTRNKVQ